MKNNFCTASLVLYKEYNATVMNLITSILDSPYVKFLYIIDNSPNKILNIKRFPNKLIYIHNCRNTGFGTAHNLAIKLAQYHNSAYHLVVNPDIVMSTETIKDMITFLEKNEQAGAVMPKVLNPNGTLQDLCRHYPTPLNLLVRRFIPFKPLRLLINSKFEIKDLPNTTPTEVPIISGCFMLLRKRTLKQCGLFDEKYFMYLEDYDLCRRIRSSSWFIYYYPQASVTHDYLTGSRKSFKLTMYHIRSTFYYFCKWGWLIDNVRKRVFI